MNAGVDMNGTPLDGATDFFIGGALFPEAEPWDIQLERALQKIEAGATFFQTQAVTDIDKFARAAEALAPTGAKLIAGVLLFKSPRVIKFINERLAGLMVPEWIADRITAAENPLEEAIAIATEQVRELREHRRRRAHHAAGRDDAVVAHSRGRRARCSAAAACAVSGKAPECAASLCCQVPLDDRAADQLRERRRGCATWRARRAAPRERPAGGVLGEHVVGDDAGAQLRVAREREFVALDVDEDGRGEPGAVDRHRDQHDEGGVVVGQAELVGEDDRTRRGLGAGRRREASPRSLRHQARGRTSP